MSTQPNEETEVTEPNPYSGSRTDEQDDPNQNADD